VPHWARPPLVNNSPWAPGSARGWWLDTRALLPLVLFPEKPHVGHCAPRRLPPGQEHVVMRCVPIKRQRGDDSNMRLVASAVFLFLNEADGARDPEKRGSHKMWYGLLRWDSETRELMVSHDEKYAWHVLQSRETRWKLLTWAYVANWWAGTLMSASDPS